MSNYSVSVIVPVFNPPLANLNRCLASIYAQSGIDFELVLVDDGSTKEIARLLDEVAESNRNTRVIHQKNQGASCARNVGTSASSGDYIFYVDCDDELAPNCFKEGLGAAMLTHADIVYGYVLKDPVKHSIGKYCSLCDGRIIDTPVSELIDFHLKGHSPNRTLCPDKGILSVKVGPIARFVKRNLALQTVFPVGVPISEDTIWNVKLLLNARSAVVVRSIWYLYWTVQDSAVNRYRPDCVDEAIVAMDYLRTEMGPEIIETFFSGYINRGIGELNRIAKMFSKNECKLSNRMKHTELSRAYSAIFSDWTLFDLLVGAGSFWTSAKLLICITGASLLIFRSSN